MNKLIIILLICITCFGSCERTEDKCQTCDFKHFFYTYDDKYFIDTLLQNDHLLIGFNKTSSLEDINSFLQETGLFTSQIV